MESVEDDDFTEELGGAPSNEMDEFDGEGSSQEDVDEDDGVDEHEVDDCEADEDEVDEDEVDEEEIDEDELNKRSRLLNDKHKAHWSAILAKYTPKHKETEEELQRRKEANDYLDRNENKTKILNIKSLRSLSVRMGQSIGPQKHFSNTSIPPPTQDPSPPPIKLFGPNNHCPPFNNCALKRQKNLNDESPSDRSPKHIRTRSLSLCQTELEEEDIGLEARTTATLPEESNFTFTALPEQLHTTTTCRVKPARRSNIRRQPFIPGTTQFAGLKSITLGLIKDLEQPRGIGVNIVTATFDARGRFAMRVNCQDINGHYVPLPAGMSAPASFEDINLLAQWRGYSSDNIREAVALEYFQQEQRPQLQR